MERREFLGIMAAGVATTALGGAVEAAAGSGPAADGRQGGPAGAAKDGKHEPKLSPEAQLVGYCGHYCGKCPLSAFNVGMGVKALEKVNDTIAVSKAADRIGFPPIHDMAVHCCAGFDRDVVAFADVTKIAFPPGCRTGCVPCDARECCKNKGYLTCAECDQTAKCEKLAKLSKEYSDVYDNLKGIGEMGLEKWAKMQHDKVVADKKTALHKAIDEAF